MKFDQQWLRRAEVIVLVVVGVVLLLAYVLSILR
jgi:hypothetical protein